MRGFGGENDRFGGKTVAGDGSRKSPVFRIVPIFSGLMHLTAAINSVRDLRSQKRKRFVPRQLPYVP